VRLRASREQDAGTAQGKHRRAFHFSIMMALS
jgi:hypothetical protein